MKHCIILGTRPEIIKMSPLVRELVRRGDDFFIIHTNQHYSESMDRIFFRELELPPAQYNLNIGSGLHGKQTGAMLDRIEALLLEKRPDVVYVEGDTNTVLAGALAAAKIGILVAHVEAGLRSYDRTMPEELNRIATDHMSDFLFAPTETSKKILLGEHIPKERIFVVGNTIADAVLQTLPLAEKRVSFLTDLGVTPGHFALLTLHRPANVDDAASLAGILQGVHRSAEKLGVPVLFPVHPRTKERLQSFKLPLPASIRAIEPCGFLEMLLLEQHSAMIMTDSGGVQEEACILKKKCVTLRDNTERPETVEVGGNILGGTTSARIVDAVATMIPKTVRWTNPFGDGSAGKRIIEIVDRGRP